MTLLELSKGKQARISGFNALMSDLEVRLREIGFAEGDRIEVLHFGLLGRNPMTVRLNGALIAMRRNEAAAVMVQLAVDE